MKKELQILTTITIAILFFGCSINKTRNQSTATPIIQSVEEALYSPKSEGILSREIALKEIVTISIFDKKGKLTDSSEFEFDGTLYKRTIYSRNSEGDMIRSETFNQSNELQFYTISEFNSDGIILNFKTYNSDNLLISTQSNVLDDRGNEINIDITNLETSKTWITKSKYNSNNQVIEQTQISPDGSTRSVRTFKYDVLGNEIESELRRPNGDYTKFISAYNENNDMTIQNWYEEDGTHKHKTSFEYNYDSNKNWITRKRYSNDEIEMIWERVIKYYE